MSDDLTKLPPENGQEIKSEDRFSVVERATMRDSVLNWLKLHKEEPIIINGKPAVVVPRQVKKRNWWPFTKRLKQQSPAIMKKSMPVVAVKQTINEQEPTGNVSEVSSHTNSAPEWPPQVNVDIVMEKHGDNVGTDKMQKTKVDSPPLRLSPVDPVLALPPNDTPLLDETDEKLLSSGKGLISDDHERIIEEIEEYVDEISHQKNQTSVMSDENVNNQDKLVVGKKSVKFDFLTASKRLYVLLWIGWFSITMLGILSPFVFSYELSVRLSKVSPVPYGLVGDTPIFLATFDKELQALTKFQSQQVGEGVSNDVLRQQVELAVVRRYLSYTLAREEQIWISQSDIDVEVSRVIEKAGSIDQVVKSIADLWGWSLLDYEKYIVRPLLTKRALQEKIGQDPVLAIEVGQPGNITQFDMYLDKISEEYSIRFFK